MLSKFFFKNLNTRAVMAMRRTFATKTDGIKGILKTEIEYEEKNYSPVDKGEMQTFFKTSGFNFTEKESSTRMELTKTQGNYDVVVNFVAKPPFPQDENAPQEGANESEKGKIFLFK
jgi:hypothetical protein